MRKSAKAFRKTLSDQGAFYTPEALAMKMCAQFPEHVAEVYDPTCGDGGLLRIFGDDVRKYGVEIDGAEAEKARSILNSTIFAGDTLADYCYQYMFYGCQSLKEVRVSATTTATDALKDWLNNVSATGDFYCDPNATIFPTGSVSGIPKGWVRRNIADYPN